MTIMHQTTISKDFLAMFSPVRAAKVDSCPEGEKHDLYNLVGFANLGKTNNHLMQLE